MTTTLILLVAALAGPEPWSAQRVAAMTKDGSLTSAPQEELTDWLGGAKALASGADAKADGLTVAFGVLAPQGSRSVVVRSLTDGYALALVRVGAGPLFAGGTVLPEGAGMRWQYEADGKPVGGPHDLEVYTYPPESRAEAGVASGRLEQQPRLTSAVFGGTWHDWWVYTSAGLDPEKESDLVVFQDGQWARGYAQPYFDHLVAQGAMRQTVAVFVTPGTFPDGRSDRSREYDTLSDAYARFLLEEVLPKVESRFKLSQDPMRRCVAGLSSGGICAFTCAWERPEKFGLVISWVGSFTNLQGGPGGFSGGNTYPAIVRARRGWDGKGAPKPIRVFLQDGANDLDNAAGSWPLANQEMAKALAYGGYDYRFVFGNGFHSDKHGRAVMADALRWLFRPSSPSRG